MARFGITYRLKSTSSDTVIARQIAYDFALKVNRTLKKTAARLYKKIPDLIRDRIVSSVEWQELQDGGDLAAEFGLQVPNGAKLAAILHAWVDSMEVTTDLAQVKVPRTDWSITIGFIFADFSDVINLYESAYISHGKYGSHKIKWLEWLLLRGSEVLVYNAKIDYNLMSVKDFVVSRSGRAIMRHNQGTWRVPPEYSGTISNNFITRCLGLNPGSSNDITKEIQKLVMDEFIKAF